MTYNIELHKKVEKFLDKQNEKFVLDFWAKAMILSNDPKNSNLDIKWLDWEEKWNFRLRIGKYRFKYEIINDQILIYFYDAGSRWDIYK